MIANKNLIESANSKGYVVRSIEQAKSNKFGKADLITIEGGQYRIKFISNVLNGVNYFKIIEVNNYLQKRVYKAERYHLKFITLINDINGNTFIKMNKQ